MADIGLGILSPASGLMHLFEDLTRAVISEISRSRIVDIIQDDPRLAMAILWPTSRDGAMVVEHLVNLGRRRALERMAHFFLERAQRRALIGQQARRKGRRVFTP